MSSRKAQGYIAVNPNVRSYAELDLGTPAAAASAAGAGSPNTLAAQIAAGTLFNTYTSAKSIINPEDLIQLPGGYWYPGKKVRVKARGAMSNIVTTPGTVAFQVMMGAVIAWSSGNVQLNAAAHTLLPWALDLDLRCDSVGAGTAAKLIGMGELRGIMFTLTAGQVDGVNSSAVLQVPATAPAVGTGFDSTLMQSMDLWAGFSINNAGNGVRLYDYTVEELN